MTPTRTVTVKASCCMDADAASTVLFGMNAAAGGVILARMSAGAELIDMA